MYYPKSQITTDLYTNGNELVVKSNSLNYIGYYYKLSTGEMFVGKKPTSGKIKLIPKEELNPSSTIEDNQVTKTITVAKYSDDPDPENLEPSPNNFYSIQNNGVYSTLKTQPKKRIIPSSFVPVLTPIDFENEEILRYFAKRNNQNLYLEISPDDYLAINSSNPKIAFDLYECVSINWSLDFEANIINRKLVDNIEKNKKWYGFHHFFKGKFGLYDNSTEILYTKGGEFLLPDRTNYIGYYHFMPNGNAMTGKYHGEGSEIILISLKSTQSPNITTTDTQTSTISGGGGGY